MGEDEDVEDLADAGGGDEVFELEGELGTFLREAAIFEGVGEIVGLADAHEEFGLGDESVVAQSGGLGLVAECGEVYVGGDVLIAGSRVGIGRGGVLAIGHYGVEVASGELFFAGVSIVDEYAVAAAILEDGGDAAHPVLGDKGRFDTTSFGWRDGIVFDVGELLW